MANVNPAAMVPKLPEVGQDLAQSNLEQDRSLGEHETLRFARRYHVLPLAQAAVRVWGRCEVRRGVID